MHPIVTYPSDSNTVPTRLDLSWEDLVELVCTHEPTECVRATCAGRECPHKKCAAWSPVLIEGTRNNANVRAVTLMVVDIDHIAPGDDRWLRAVIGEGYLWACASSHQHCAAEERYRLVIPLSRPATPAEYPRLRRAWIERLQIPADPRARDLSRIYYLPTSRADCPPERDWAQSGRPIDVDAELAAAPPERDYDLPDREGGAADWLEDACGPITEADARKILTMLDALPKRDQGKGSTYQAFCLIFHDFGLGIATGWPLLVHWNEGCGQPHTPEQLERQFYRCASRAHERPRGWQRGGDVVAGIVAAITRPPEGSWAAEQFRADKDVADKLGAPQDRPRRQRPLFEPFEALRARQIPDVEWLVQGLIKRGGTAILGGRSKIGKSFLLKEVARALATGTPCFGKFAVPAPRRVAYFFAEDYAGDVRAHIDALAAEAGGDFRGRLFVEPRGEYLDLRRNEDVADLVASVRAMGGVDALILEPLRDLHGAKESDSDEMKEVMRRFAMIGTILDCTTITVQHETKPPQEGKGGKRKGGERMRGSGAIYASADTVISASPIGERSPTRLQVLVECETRGARSADDFALALDIVDGPGGQAERARFSSIEAAPQDDAPAANRDVLDAVAAEVERHALGTLPELSRWRERGCQCPPGAVIHARDLSEARGAHRVDGGRGKIRAAVRELVDAGRLVRVGGEHGSLQVPRARLDALVAELSAAV